LEADRALSAADVGAMGLLVILGCEHEGHCAGINEQDGAGAAKTSGLPTTWRVAASGSPVTTRADPAAASGSPDRVPRRQHGNREQPSCVQERHRDLGIVEAPAGPGGDAIRPNLDTRAYWEAPVAPGSPGRLDLLP
jgi:hypothetical protein